jgi:hypothetical protein
MVGIIRRRKCMSNELIEKRIEKSIRFFDEPNALQKQTEGIAAIKKMKAHSSIMSGILLFVLVGLGGMIYGIADIFGGATLPMGFIFFIGGLIVTIWIGPRSISRGIKNNSASSIFTFATDIETLCRDFYYNVFCKKTTGITDKDDQIIEVCQYIPLPVLEIYKNSGWDAFITRTESKGEGQPLECSICHKESAHSEAYTGMIPISAELSKSSSYKESLETQKLINGLYLKCQYCGAVFCYICIETERQQEHCFLCPACGMATNGWKGLAKRWMSLRESSNKEDVDFSLTDIHVEKTPCSDPRIFDISIRLKSPEFGDLLLYNVAFNIKGKWFLASPEPYR